ncbi:MAG: hypothetical protein U0P46_11725 [Holophagaceae bacterium]
MDRDDGLDDGEVGGIQLEGLLVGLDGPLGAAAPHQAFGLARELLDAQALERVHFGLATVAGDLLGRPGLEARREARGGEGGRGRRGGPGHHAQALQLPREVADEGLVVVLVGHAVGALERLHLVGAVAALVGDLREEGPALDADAALQGVAQAAADDVARAAAGQLAGDGGEEAQALLGAVGADQVPQGLLAEGQGLLGQLGHFGQGLEGSVRMAAAQFDLGQGLQQLGVAGVAGKPLAKVLGRCGVVALDDAQAALGQVDLGGGDHGLGAFQDLVGFAVHLLHGQ